jgi:hypothetical protein
MSYQNGGQTNTSSGPCPSNPGASGPPTVRNDQATSYSPEAWAAKKAAEAVCAHKKEILDSISNTRSECRTNAKTAYTTAVNACPLTTEITVTLNASQSTGGSVDAAIAILKKAGVNINGELSLMLQGGVSGSFTFTPRKTCIENNAASKDAALSKCESDYEKADDVVAGCP